MNYWGKYADKAIPFLKKVLSKQYRNYHPSHTNSYYAGCRGPNSWREQIDSEEFSYVNWVTPGSDFWTFSGHEEIFVDDRNDLGSDTEGGGTLHNLGWHRYNGCTLQ
jgi:hypothetical protein